MQLYLFNNIKIKPYVILIVRVLDEQEYEYIQNNFTNIFEILIEDDIAVIDDLLVFSLIKEFNKKIENFIQPFSKKNEDKIEIFDNSIIIDVLKNINCNISYECYSNTIKKKFCNINMEFLIEKYGISN
jgi:hypothetical protein